jgi:hypothetical protein
MPRSAATWWSLRGSPISWGAGHSAVAMPEPAWPAPATAACW